MLDQLEQRILGPVQVVEDHDQRTNPRGRLEQAPYRPRDLGRRRRDPVAVDQCADCGGDGFVVCEQRADSAGGGVTLQLADHVDRGPQPDSRAVGQASCS